MSDSPKFEVIDRRKLKAEEEQQNLQREQNEAALETGQAAAPTKAGEAAREAAAPVAQPESKPAAASSGPRLVENPPTRESPQARESEPGRETASEPGPDADLAAEPTAQESHQQKAAYDASAQRVEDLIRAQNPGVGAQPPVTFEHLIQQFYVSALLQMGAGAQEGQRPQVDILGARNTIDMLGILADKTSGNLTGQESRMLQSVLFELRMAFLEFTSMINMPSVQPPPPSPKKR